MIKIDKRFDIDDYKVMARFVKKSHEPAHWIRLCMRYSGYKMYVFDTYASIALMTRAKPGRPAEPTNEALIREMLLSRYDETLAMIGLVHPEAGPILSLLTPKDFAEGCAEDLATLPVTIIDA